MEEKKLSWRASLARKNINILNIEGDRWFYEFMYHPYPGQTKWCKTYYEATAHAAAYIAGQIEKEVLALRKELER